MPSAYIETSVPSYCVARPSENLIQVSKQTSTRRRWERGCSGLELFTSVETLEEASRGDSEMAGARLRLLHGIRLLEITEDVSTLAASLVELEPFLVMLPRTPSTSPLPRFTVWTTLSLGISNTSRTRSSGKESARTLLKAAFGNGRSEIRWSLLLQQKFHSPRQLDPARIFP